MGGLRKIFVSSYDHLCKFLMVENYTETIQMVCIDGLFSTKLNIIIKTKVGNLESKLKQTQDDKISTVSNILKKSIEVPAALRSK